jgi:hypothetical protein
MKNLINTAIVSLALLISNYALANFQDGLDAYNKQDYQLHCPVDANTITERIGNISEVFATVFAKQCDGDIGMLGFDTLYNFCHSVQ